MTTNGHDLRLIEDFLPLQALNLHCAKDNNSRKGHIKTLHLWWARRPLVACRAAIYASLVPAHLFSPANGSEAKSKGLGRATAARFVDSLCTYPGARKQLEKAQRQILKAHADRLSEELADARDSSQWPSWVEEFNWPQNIETVTADDIDDGRAPRPRVLDPFAGGGAIPLEALRLGCDSHAVDINPVAHLIQLSTLVFPQLLGSPSDSEFGHTGPSRPGGTNSWGGLAAEVRYLGSRVLRDLQKDLGQLFPPIPDPSASHSDGPPQQHDLWKQTTPESAGLRQLVPFAFLWTRTVRCKNPGCPADVPLVRQTWLRRKKKGPFIALRVTAPPGGKQVSFEIVSADKQSALGFDPADFSQKGNATCPFCRSVADSDYVKAEGVAGRLGHQPMAVVAIRPGTRGKVYLDVDAAANCLPDNQVISKRIEALLSESGLTRPNEPLVSNPRSMDVHRYGISTWEELFTPRQLLVLLSFCAHLKSLPDDLRADGYSDAQARAITTYLALIVDKMADYSNILSRWGNDDEGIANAYSRQALPMVWDYAEASPLLTHEQLT